MVFLFVAWLTEKIMFGQIFITQLRNCVMLVTPLVDIRLIDSKPSLCWAEPPSLWSHFDNLGPRTINLVKGWHNGLNSNLGVSHPSMLSYIIQWDIFLLSIPTCYCYGQFQYTLAYLFRSSRFRRVSSVFYFSQQLMDNLHYECLALLYSCGYLTNSSLPMIG